MGILVNARNTFVLSIDVSHTCDNFCVALKINLSGLDVSFHKYQAHSGNQIPDYTKETFFTIWI